MGTVRKTATERTAHWADANFLRKNPTEIRQPKSLDGQQSLFDDVDIDHLEEKPNKKRKRNSAAARKKLREDH